MSGQDEILKAAAQETQDNESAEGRQSAAEQDTGETHAQKVILRPENLTAECDALMERAAAAHGMNPHYGSDNPAYVIRQCYMHMFYIETARVRLRDWLLNFQPRGDSKARRLTFTLQIAIEAAYRMMRYALVYLKTYIEGSGVVDPGLVKDSRIIIGNSGEELWTPPEVDIPFDEIAELREKIEQLYSDAKEIRRLTGGRARTEYQRLIPPLEEAYRKMRTISSATRAVTESACKSRCSGYGSVTDAVLDIVPYMHQHLRVRSLAKCIVSGHEVRRCLEIMEDMHNTGADALRAIMSLERIADMNVHRCGMQQYKHAKTVFMLLCRRVQLYMTDMALEQDRPEYREMRDELIQCWRSIRRMFEKRRVILNQSCLPKECIHYVIYEDSTNDEIRAALKYDIGLMLDVVGPVLRRAADMIDEFLHEKNGTWQRPQKHAAPEQEQQIKDLLRFERLSSLKRQRQAIERKKKRHLERMRRR